LGPRRGELFAGRYEVIEEIGRGGMGRVYKVFDKKVKEKIALKILNPEIASDKVTLERFENELRIARKIAHKNVCRLFDLDEEQGVHYITMEYVSGEDLRSLIRRVGQLTVGKSLVLAKQVCAGLKEAHALGIIHRDLKPQNIMIDREGNAHIMDFGIARSLTGKGVTGTGMIVGTPEYMSPEQIESKELDERSDIYALGVILFEVLTEKVPFEGDTAVSIIYKHKNEPVPNPKKINRHIPDALNRLILKCLEKNKENRYQNVDELLKELSQIQADVPSTEKIIPEKKPLTSREIAVKFSLKKLLVPALIALGVIIIGLAVWRLPPLLESMRSSTPVEVLPQDTSVDADPFDVAQKYWDEKDYEGAIEEFMTILKTDPTNYRAQVSIAGILHEQGKIDEAIQEYEKAILLDASIPDTYYKLGTIFEEKQELENAFTHFRKYIELSPEGSLDDAVYDKVVAMETQLAQLKAEKEVERSEESVQIERKPEIKKEEPTPVKVKQKQEPEKVKTQTPAKEQARPERKPAEKTVPEKSEKPPKVEPKREAVVKKTEKPSAPVKKETTQIPTVVKLKIKVDNARVFSQPSDKSKTIKQLPMGIVIQSKEQKGDWHLVDLPSASRDEPITGYIHQADVDILDVSGSITPKGQSEAKAELKIRVVKDNAAVREKPDKKGKVVRALPRGIVLKTGKKTGNWYHVLLPSASGKTPTTGYIHQEDVEIVK
jgi:serine/threonine protein kinase